MADIFVSYTSADRDWAFWIAAELEKLGHQPHVHDWEIQGGDDIYSWMENRIGGSDHVLCVTSDDYLKAPYSTLERNAALWQAAAKRPGFVLLVVVKSCAMPTLTDHLRRCELFNCADTVARDRFREFMSQRSRPSGEIAFPGQTLAISNIKVRVPACFVGRDSEFAAIDEALRARPGKMAIAALHGMRGVGKTTLAAVYAELQRTKYRGIWWIRAQTEPALAADLAALGERLQWLGAQDPPEQAAEKVLERLRHEGAGFLLVYDNAQDRAAIEHQLPRGEGCRVLVTSNSPNWRGIATAVRVLQWPVPVGADYLIARTGRDAERSAAEALSDALGGLPLAHEQAAAYCERKDISLAEYRKRFAARPEIFLNDEKHAPVDHHDGMTVAKSFALAIDEATIQHPAAELLIVMAANLADEPVPLFLFSEARETLGSQAATLFDGDGLDDAVAALRAFALVERKPLLDEHDASRSTDAINLHRLVRQVAASRQSADDRGHTRRALARALAEVYPRAGAESETQRRHEKQQLIPHVLAALHYLNDDESLDDARDLLDSMVRLVIFTLYDVGARNISPEYLTPALATFYEIQPLGETIAQLLKDDAAWPALQRRLLAADNYVLRYAMAEAIANAWGVDKIRALFDGGKDLNEFELAGYALCLKYAGDTTLIDPTRLEALANREAYPGRSILGDLFINLAFGDADDLRERLPSARFWNSAWDFIALDVQTIIAAQAFRASPAQMPASLVVGSEAARAYDHFVAIGADIERLAPALRSGSVLAELMRGYTGLGQDPARVEDALEDLAALDRDTLRDVVRVFFAHPIWAVAETAATVLSTLIERDESAAAGRLDIIRSLLGDANWRVQFGANEAAFAARHFDAAIFPDSIERFYNHWNCKIRGLCAENLTSVVLNSSLARRDELLRRYAAHISFWVRDEDCWVLEHVFRLFRALRARKADFDWLLAGGVSRLMRGEANWHSLDREAFLRLIERNKSALAVHPN